MTAILEHGDGNCKEARDKCVNEIVRNGIGAADWSNELHAMLFLREHRFLTSRTILKVRIFALLSRSCVWEGLTSEDTEYD